MSNDAGGVSASNDGLGLAPEREGQPRLMTVTPAQADNMHGHWYSPAAVREMLAAERERVASACWERRGHFASDGAARAFAELVRAGRPND